jgi:putative alpha-1,2-mannosidase
VESNIFQQSWFVPYDVEGLARLFGKERMIALMEELFERADFGALWNEDYNHSNEPCHNLTHYFNVIGLPERTQYWTRRVQKEAYRLGAFGFCGNEDVGQLSAWYVLSALGFAQICMGEGRYELNTPLFRRATVTLDKKYHKCAIADTFTVVCDKDPLEYPYIEGVMLNGETINRTYLTYDEITNGGTLRLTLKA